MRSKESKVVFNYRYYYSKVQDDYIAITNLRLEVVQVGNGRLLYTLAAPTLDTYQGRLSVGFADSGLLFITSGHRENIIVRESTLKPNESASPVSHFGTKEVTENSKSDILERVYDMLKAPAYPGIDMRVPDMYRLTKNPEKIRLNISPELLSALGIEDTRSYQEINRVFLDKIDTIASLTSEGYAIPFDWVYNGGMVCASASEISKTKIGVLHTRSLEFFKRWVIAKKWRIACI